MTTSKSMRNTGADRSDECWLHVVAAVIRVDEQILLARRPLDKHQGGKWEFPGGKVESGESPEQALIRELNEELGVQADSCAMRPFIEIRHRYPGKNIYLNVWEVGAFTGKPEGREGQDVGWFTVDELAALDFPEANVPILEKIANLY